MAIFENKASDSAKAEAGKEKKNTGVTAGMRNVLVKPRISEKSAKANESGKYIFEVSRNANKVEVKKAVEKSYSVVVTKVNIVTTEGKKRAYGKTNGRMSDFKKAIVTLKKGQTIETPEANI